MGEVFKQGVVNKTVGLCHTILDGSRCCHAFAKRFQIVYGAKDVLTGAFFVPAIEVLTIFVLSILVCAVLYTACALYDDALVRRRESWKGARSSIENRPLKGSRPPT